MLQTILVYIIVLACAVYALWRAYGWLRVRRDSRGGGSGASCPPGCTGCDDLLAGTALRPGGAKNGGESTGGGNRLRELHGLPDESDAGSDRGASTSIQRNPDTCNVPHHRRNKIPRNTDDECGCG